MRLRRRRSGGRSDSSGGAGPLAGCCHVSLFWCPAMVLKEACCRYGRGVRADGLGAIVNKSRHHRFVSAGGKELGRRCGCRHESRSEGSAIRDADGVFVDWLTLTRSASEELLRNIPRRGVRYSEPRGLLLTEWLAQIPSLALQACVHHASLKGKRRATLLKVPRLLVASKAMYSRNSTQARRLWLRHSRLVLRANGGPCPEQP